ncbi:hypothetical protein EIC82_13085 [Enterobacter sp. A11]|nr:hypothetical protein EIC82_13085 [Enterobacter sp. A11]
MQFCRNYFEKLFWIRYLHTIITESITQL